MKNTFPKISVVIPSYNQGKYLESTLLSIIEQNYPNLEIILIDGGSNDESLDIIKKYSHYLSYWQSEPDGGQSNAINVGFKKANGEILCWLNSDDSFLPNSLFHVAEVFNKSSFGFYYSDVFLIDTVGKKFKRIKARKTSYIAQVYGYFAIPQQASFWTPEVFRRAGPLNESNKTCMDGEFYINVLKIKNINIVKENIPLANFRIHPESLTGSSRNKVQYKKDRYQLIVDHENRINWFKKYYYKYFLRFISKLIET